MTPPWNIGSFWEGPVLSEIFIKAPWIYIIFIYTPVAIEVNGTPEINLDGWTKPFVLALCNRQSSYIVCQIRYLISQLFIMKCNSMTNRLSFIHDQGLSLLQSKTKTHCQHPPVWFHTAVFSKRFSVFSVLCIGTHSAYRMETLKLYEVYQKSVNLSYFDMQNRKYEKFIEEFCQYCVIEDRLWNFISSTHSKPNLYQLDDWCFFEYSFW